MDRPDEPIQHFCDLQPSEPENGLDERLDEGLARLGRLVSAASTRVQTTCGIWRAEACITSHRGAAYRLYRRQK